MGPRASAAKPSRHRRTPRRSPTHRSPAPAARGALCDRLVVAITGSIGALWAAQFVLELRAEGHVREVRVVMSESATAFVTPMAMRAISGAPVLTSLVGPHAPWAIGHVQISEGADALLVMPATANIIGKAAGGISDDAVSASILAAACPVVFVPNMNDRMWRHPAVRRNVRTLIRDGRHVVSPEEGVVVSTLRRGTGGMPSFDVIRRAIRAALR